MEKLKLLFPFLLFSTLLHSQCEVYITPGSSIVYDHNPGISFGFEIQNDSDIPYTGGTLGVNFLLCNDNVWDFEFSPSSVIFPGESKYIGTPIFDIPLPENAQDWYCYDDPANPDNYFPWYLYLDNETQVDGEYCWDVITDPTQPNGYFNNPLSDGCDNPDGDIFCNDGCEIEVVDFNLETAELTIIPYSTYCPNNNSPIFENQYPFNDPYIFGFVLNFNWGIGQINISTGSSNIYASNEPITIDLNNLLSNLTYQNMVEAINNGEFCDLALTLYNINNSGGQVWQAPSNQSIELLDLCPEIEGCTNSSALNYNPEATIDDGSCEYFEGGCDLELIGFDTETFDLTIAVNNGYGCSNPNADDYDPFNDDIYDLVIGIHSITESEPYSCFFNQNPNDPYYGWALLNFPIDLPLALYDIGQGSDGSLNTGDTITVNLAEASNFNTQESCLAEAFVNGYFDNCSQIVIWQINDSNGSDFWNGYFEASQWNGDDFPYPEYWDESVDCIPGDSDWSTICNNQLSFGPLCGGDPPPPIPEGCLDPDAYNYDPEAVLDDDSCEYVDLNYYQTTVYFDCDTTNVNQWTFTTQIKVSNIGDVAVDNWCVQGYIDGDVDNPFFDECYPITIEPGDIYTLYMPDVINPVDLGYTLPLDNITYVVYGVEGENVLYNNDQTIPNELIQYFNCIETGCTDQLACNYDPEANAGNPEEECNYPDECGECDGENSGPGAIYDCGCDPLPFPDACDCEGNEPIDLFQCDCEGTPDLDQDGICDEEDDCVGYIDECGVCNGPGAIYDCGCFDIPDGDCDCLGNTLDGCGECGGDGVDIDGDGLCDDVDPCIGFYDDCGVCNGDNSTCYGCTDPEADNYDLTAWFDDGSCIYCSTDVWAPNAVTPNNDGVNDVWQVVTEYPDCWRIWETKIYNRWGQLVWYSEDITDKWVVNVQGGQYYVSDGVYIYVIRGETWGITNSIFHQTGHITVFR